MLKILDNKYKIQTFFDQVAEILDKEEEDFIERIRFKSTTEFIQQMDKYILYLEQNAFFNFFFSQFGKYVRDVIGKYFIGGNDQDIIGRDFPFVPI